jgi:hypothetical protein
MTVKELSEELSIKLGDAVSSGSSDGQIFTSDTRLGYVRRAYAKLNRVLKSLMRTESPEFTKSVDYIRYQLRIMKKVQELVRMNILRSIY